jgi:hypothetical protein
MPKFKPRLAFKTVGLLLITLERLHRLYEVRMRSTFRRYACLSAQSNRALLSLINSFLYFKL